MRLMTQCHEVGRRGETGKGVKLYQKYTIYLEKRKLLVYTEQANKV